MLLRWLVDNYVREAAQGKVRAVVTDVLQGTGREAPVLRPPAATELTLRDSDTAERRTRNPEPSSSPDDFIPCDAAFIFALGIESGGLVDRLQGAERSR